MRTARAVQFFESEGCKNQGFIYNGKVVALQFHPEVNEERIQSLLKRFGEGMANGLFMQKKRGNARAEKMSGCHKGIYVFDSGQIWIMI